MKGWLLSPGLSLLLAVLGTSGLGYSWYVQTFELVRATENVSRLQRSQIVIDTDEISRDQWIIALDQEVAKHKPDEALLSTAAHQALDGVVTWQTHMMGRVADSSEEYATELAVRDALRDKAEKLDEAKNYKELMLILSQILAKSKASNTTANLDQEFFASVDAANAKVAELERQVQIAYFAATAFLLLSSALGSVFLELAFRRMTNEALQLVASRSRRK